MKWIAMYTYHDDSKDTNPQTQWIEIVTTGKMQAKTIAKELAVKNGWRLQSLTKEGTT